MLYLSWSLPGGGGVSLQVMAAFDSVLKDYCAEMPHQAELQNLRMSPGVRAGGRPGGAP